MTNQEIIDNMGFEMRDDLAAVFDDVLELMDLARAGTMKECITTLEAFLPRHREEQTPRTEAVKMCIYALTQLEVSNLINQNNYD